MKCDSESEEQQVLEHFEWSLPYMYKNILDKLIYRLLIILKPFLCHQHLINNKFQYFDVFASKYCLENDAKRNSKQLFMCGWVVGWAYVCLKEKRFKMKMCSSVHTYIHMYIKMSFQDGFLYKYY